MKGRPCEGVGLKSPLPPWKPREKTNLCGLSGAFLPGCAATPWGVQNACVCSMTLACHSK